MLPFPYKKEIHVFRCFFCKDQAYFSYTDLYEENNYKKDQTWIVPVLVIIHENKTQVEKNESKNAESNKEIDNSISAPPFR